MLLPDLRGLPLPVALLIALAILISAVSGWMRSLALLVRALGLHP